MRIQPSGIFVSAGLLLSFAWLIPALEAAPAAKIPATKAPPVDKSIQERAVSPDHTHFAFVKTSAKTVSSGQGDVSADSIWYGTIRGNSAKPLFEPGAKVNTDQAIGEIEVGDIHSLNFSPDGRTLYFLCACYAVSGAAIAVDLQTRKLKYVVDANTLRVIQRGKQKGYLIVTRHRYHPRGGSYEKVETVKP